MAEMCFLKPQQSKVIILSEALPGSVNSGPEENNTKDYLPSPAWPGLETYSTKYYLPGRFGPIPTTTYILACPGMIFLILILIFLTPRDCSLQLNQVLHTSWPGREENIIFPYWIISGIILGWALDTY